MTAKSCYRERNVVDINIRGCEQMKFIVCGWHGWYVGGRGAGVGGQDDLSSVGGEAGRGVSEQGCKGWQADRNQCAGPSKHFPLAGGQQCRRN